MLHLLALAQPLTGPLPLPLTLPLALALPLPLPLPLSMPVPLSVFGADALACVTTELWGTEAMPPYLLLRRCPFLRSSWAAMHQLSPYLLLRRCPFLK